MQHNSRPHVQQASYQDSEYERLLRDYNPLGLQKMWLCGNDPFKRSQSFVTHALTDFNEYFGPYRDVIDKEKLKRVLASIVHSNIYKGYILVGLKMILDDGNVQINEVGPMDLKNVSLGVLTIDRHQPYYHLCVQFLKPNAAIRC